MAYSIWINIGLGESDVYIEMHSNFLTKKHNPGRPGEITSPEVDLMLKSECSASSNIIWSRLISQCCFYSESLSNPKSAFGSGSRSIVTFIQGRLEFITWLCSSKKGWFNSASLFVSGSISVSKSRFAKIPMETRLDRRNNKFSGRIE